MISKQTNGIQEIDTGQNAKFVIAFSVFFIVLQLIYISCFI